MLALAVIVSPAGRPETTEAVGPIMAQLFALLGLCNVIVAELEGTFLATLKLVVLVGLQLIALTPCM